MTKKATYDFQGKTILITGGAGDIGQTTARRFAANGAGVVLLDLNAAKMADVAQELKAYKVPVSTFGCDVTVADDVAKAFAGAVKQFGRIDYVFNKECLLRLTSIPRTTFKKLSTSMLWAFSTFLKLLLYICALPVEESSSIWQAMQGWLVPQI